MKKESVPFRPAGTRDATTISAGSQACSDQAKRLLSQGEVVGGRDAGSTAHRKIG
jgi:hypothetical protein